VFLTINSEWRDGVDLVRNVFKRCFPYTPLKEERSVWFPNDVHVTDDEEFGFLSVVVRDDKKGLTFLFLCLPDVVRAALIEAGIQPGIDEAV
jgi:hypothetical protein